MFLTQLQNVSSLLVGDGSFPPTPGIPRVTSRNFTSISLKWDPVQNTIEAVVYLVEMTLTGEKSRSSPKYVPEVNRPEYFFVVLFWSSSKTLKDIFFFTIFF